MPAPQNGTVVELIVYRLQEGTTEQAFADAYDKLSKWLADKPGFLTRELLRVTDDGRYFEIVWWTNRPDADAVAAASATDAACAPFFAVIDMATAELIYGEPAAPIFAV